MDLRSLEVSVRRIRRSATDRYQLALMARCIFGTLNRTLYGLLSRMTPHIPKVQTSLVWSSPGTVGILRHEGATILSSVGPPDVLSRILTEC